MNRHISPRNCARSKPTRFLLARRLAAKRLFDLFAIILLMGASANAVFAHPLGNFTINHYSRLEIASTELRLFVVLDLAEIPTFQEQPLIDQDKDGKISDDERARYLSTKTQDLQRNLQLQIDGKPVNLTLVPTSVELSFPPGQGGLSIMRLSAWFTTALSFSGAQPLTINYRDESYPATIGWREIVVRTGDGISLLESNVHTRESSDELRTYPQDMLSSPLNDREAKLKIALSGPPASANPASRPSADGASRSASSDIALSVIFIAVLIATVGVIFLFIRWRQSHL